MAPPCRRRTGLSGAHKVEVKPAAAFDTRLTAPPLFTGRAGLRIAKRLRRAAFKVADEPVSFLVDKQNQLLDGELERARAWGGQLAGARGEGQP